MAEVRKPGKGKAVEESLAVTPEMAAANRQFLEDWKKQLALANEKQRLMIGESIGVDGFKPIFFGDHDSEDD